MNEQTKPASPSTPAAAEASLKGTSFAEGARVVDALLASSPATTSPASDRDVSAPLAIADNDGVVHDDHPPGDVKKIEGVPSPQVIADPGTSGSSALDAGSRGAVTPRELYRQVGDDEYADLEPIEKLKAIRADWEKAKTPREKAFLEGRALEVTFSLETCPDGKLTIGGCLCEVCRSYGE